MSRESLRHTRMMADVRGGSGRLSVRPASPGRARRQTLSPLEPLPVIERCEDMGVSLLQLARMVEEAAL